MTTSLKNIKFIPKNVKTRIVDELYKQITLVGYKKVSINHQIRVIELSSKQRIWFLKHEIS